MILYSSPPSPFGRKIKIALSCLGMRDDVTVRVVNTMDPEDDIRGINPLGKIPALDTGDTVIFDSRAILEYLDSQAGGGKILPAGGDDRYAVLTMAALADGIMDAAILMRDLRIVSCDVSCPASGCAVVKVFQILVTEDTESLNNELHAFKVYFVVKVVRAKLKTTTQ